MIEPHVTLITAPVMALARSEAINTAASFQKKYILLNEECTNVFNSILKT